MDLRDELLRLEAALAARDPNGVEGGLMSVIADDFVEFGRSGRVWTRDSIREPLEVPPGAPVPIARRALRRHPGGSLRVLQGRGAMRAAALVALLLVGCTGMPAASTVPATDPVTAAPATATPMPSPTSPPTAPPTATPEAATDYTADDEKIAELIRAGAAEAIPQLKEVRDMDPEERSVLFVPLLEWITSQTEGVEAYTPSGCTTAAVALFLEGMEQFDSMRKRFLAWRDWGAHNDPFSPAAPGQAVQTFEEALVELDAYCPV